MATLINTTIGESRGKDRIWLEGTKLAREGIDVGRTYRRQTGAGKILIRMGGGSRVVSRRKRRGWAKVLPLLEIRGDNLRQLFNGVTRLRVVVRAGTISITAHQLYEQIQRRERDLIERIRRGEPLSIGSLFHGGGTLDDAVHTGLARAGLDSYVAVAVEIDGRYLESSLQNNPHLWRDDSLIIESPLELLDLQRSAVALNMVVAGIPCTGAAKDGRAKNGLSCAEEHASAGAAFHYFLTFITASNPAIIQLENVTQYAGTASMAVIRQVLQDRGYRLQERTVAGNEFGALEDRERLCGLAISEGLADLFDLDAVQPVRQKEATIADVLDEVPADDEVWKPFTALFEKESRDQAKGNGFRMAVTCIDDPKCKTIKRNYAKASSGMVLIQHPDRPDLYRMLTEAEHARVKTIPERLIANLPKTVAHEICGQGVIRCAFEAVFAALGCSLIAGLQQEQAA